MVKVFGVAAPAGGIGYGATNDPGLADLTRAQWAECSWALASDHRGIKPCTGVERRPCRSAAAPRNHTGRALRAFLQ